MSPMSQQEYATVNRWHDNVNGPEPIMSIERRTIIGARVDRVALVRIPIAADSEQDIDPSWEFVRWEDQPDRLRAAAQEMLQVVRRAGFPAHRGDEECYCDTCWSYLVEEAR